MSKIMADAKPANCVPESQNATFHLSTSLSGTAGFYEPF